MEPTDDVAVLLEDARPGDRVTAGGKEIELKDAIPRFHKVALRRIEAGEGVRKMGALIGVAVRRIDPGEHVHVHNLRSSRAMEG